VFNLLVEPVAQTCSLYQYLSKSSRRDDFSPKELRTSNVEHRTPNRQTLAALDVRCSMFSVRCFGSGASRARLYRRFLTCELPPASNVLPITNRRYGRLSVFTSLRRDRAEAGGEGGKICATTNKYPSALGVAKLPALSR
jgi:hypothetical protein